MTLELEIGLAGTRTRLTREVPGSSLELYRTALTAHENGGELPPGWIMPPVRDDATRISEEEAFDSNKPRMPPDTLDFFEWQRTISKLTEWH